MSPGWLLLSLPGLALFGWMWWRCHRAVRALRDAPLLRLPLQAAQDFDLPTTGRLLVAGSYPRASIAFVRAQPRVSRAADGEPLPVQRPLANFDTRGAKGWAPLGHFDVDQPGRYRLEIVGIPEDIDTTDHALLVARGSRWDLMRYGFGTVLGSMGALTCLAAIVIGVGGSS